MTQKVWVDLINIWLNECKCRLSCDYCSSKNNYDVWKKAAWRKYKEVVAKYGVSFNSWTFFGNLKCKYHVHSWLVVLIPISTLNRKGNLLLMHHLYRSCKYNPVQCTVTRTSKVETFVYIQRNFSFFDEYLIPYTKHHVPNGTHVHIIYVCYTYSVCHHCSYVVCWRRKGDWSRG